MRRFRKNRWIGLPARMLCGAFLLLSAANAWAGGVQLPIHAEVQTTLVEETQTEVNLGSIPLSPLGDSIIMDARNGGAPVSEQGIIIQNGSLGAVQITASGAFTVTALMPPSAVLTGSNTGDTIDLIEIQTYSLHNTPILSVNSGGRQVALVAIGGKLELSVTTKSDIYTGSVQVNLQYSDP